MRTTVNGKPCNVPPGCATLGDLLAFVEADCIPPGHVITGIELDGRELSAEEERDSLDLPSAGVQEVALHSARALDLAREGLEQALEVLPTLAEAIRECAGLLREGRDAEGLDLLYDCLGQVEWYTGLIGALEIYFGQLVPEGEDLLGEGDSKLTELGLGNLPDGPELRTFASVDNLRTRLIEAQRLQSAGDLRGLAGLLEHELLPIAKLWAREAPLLLRRVAREGAMA